MGVSITLNEGLGSLLKRKGRVKIPPGSTSDSGIISTLRLTYSSARQNAGRGREHVGATGSFGISTTALVVP